VARYTVLIYPEEEGGYSVIIPLLHTATQGETFEDALRMASEAAELRIEALVEDGEPILEEEEPPIIASIEVDIP
jgi:predicted RNase H-like HicB family nuclease